MNVRRAHEVLKSFVTGVSLVTTQGPLGANVSAAEWTYVVSYNPFLLSVHINPDQATHAAIVKSRAFGISVVSERQVRQLGFAGTFSRFRTNKLTSDLFRVFPASRIDVPLISGARLNAECRLVRTIRLGDHTEFVGEVLSYHVARKERPLAYRQGPYRLGGRIRRKSGLSVALTLTNRDRGGALAVDGLLTTPSASPTPLVLEFRGPGGCSMVRRRLLRPHSLIYHFEVSLGSHRLAGTWRVTASARGQVGRATVVVRVGKHAVDDYDG
ncbi:MAG: flavin reductase family protein [Thermoplasmata archaeon]